jgi:putative peptidoglycan lipid II flippase
MPAIDDIDPGDRSGHAHLKTGVLFSLIQVAGLVFVAGQDVIAARLFGARSEMDGYLAAWVVPTTLATILGAGIQNALGPHFAQKRSREGPGAAWDLASESIAVVLLLFAAIAVVGILAEPLVLRLIASNAPAATLAISRKIYPVGFLFAGTTLAIAVLGGLCASVGRFLLPAVLSNLSGASPTFFLWVLGKRVGIFALPMGMLAGTILQAAILLYALHALGLRLHLPRRGVVRRLLPLAKDGVAVVLASAPLAGIVISERAFALHLGEGAASHLAYSAKLVSAAVRGLASGVSAMGLPLLSAFVARGEEKRFQVAIGFLWRLSLYAAVASFVGLAIAGEPLTRLLFQRGKFEASDTIVVAQVLVWYSASLVYWLAYPPINATILAFGRARSLPAINIAGLAAYLLVAWIGTRILGFGVVGLGAAYAFSVDLVLLLSVGYLVSVGILKPRVLLQGMGRALLIVPLIAVPEGLCRWGLATWGVPLVPSVLILFAVGALSTVCAVSVADPEVRRRVLSALTGLGKTDDPIEAAPNHGHS